MKEKFKPFRLFSWLIAGVTILTAMMVLAGCQEEPTLADKGYTVSVTYDYNGGVADSESKRVLYYKENQPLLAPGASVEFKEPALDRFHVLDGWYRALLDDKGLVRKDENGNILTEDAPFEWQGARATENCVIVAKWRAKPVVELVVEGQENIIYPVDAGKSVTSRILGTVLPNVENKTFLDYYTDPACTERAVLPLQIKDGEHVTLYTKWLDGEVLVVRTKNDLSKLALFINKTVYLDADIDMGGSPIPAITSFGGKFLGNGHTIRNVRTTVNLTGRNASYGLFGELSDGAQIQDVTFQDVKLTVNARFSNQSLFHIAFLSGSVKGKAILSGVKLTDCEIQLTLPDKEHVTNAIEVDQPYAGILGGLSASASVTYEHCEGTVSFTAP